MMETEMRKGLIKEIINEIRGPRYGSEEIISYDPWDEYLIGTLIPVRWKSRKERKNNVDLNLNPDWEIVDESDYVSSEDGSTDLNDVINSSSSILNPNVQIKSFGFSFILESEDIPEFDVCITWARYFLNEEAKEAYSLNSDNISWEESSEFWERKSFGSIKNIILNDDLEDINLNECGDGNINLHIKFHEISSNKFYVSIFLINDLNPSNNYEDYRPETKECIFHPSIRVDIKDNSLSRIDSMTDSDSELDFLYREKPILASGHLCSVVWKDVDYIKEFEDYNDLLWPDESIQIKNDEKFSKFIEPTLRSEFVPLYPITLPNFKLEESSDKLDLKAYNLANSSPNQLCDNLMEICRLYSDWIEKNKKIREKILSSKSDEKYKFIIDGDETHLGIIPKEEIIRDRIRQGINLIKSEPLVYLAFCFANKTIHIQDSWKKEFNNKLSKDDKDFKCFEWRVFQMAFILINLESIWNNDSDYKNVLDLLWIPTGGGKTEAYLGLMAFTMALRRLKSKFGDSVEKSGAGVSIISRYTLRLLTVQQFRRTLRMVAAAEYLRVYRCKNGAVGWRPEFFNSDKDWIYGTVRFSAGMWVGRSVTPLHLNKKKDEGAMQILQKDSIPSSSNPAQIIKCPVCGSWLSIPEEGLTDESPEVHLVIQSSKSRKEIYDDLKFVENQDYIKCIDVSQTYLKDTYFTVSIFFKSPISIKTYESIIKILEDSYAISFLGKFHPGYFHSRGVIGQRKSDKTDFEIWCTNPDCKLNQFWKEGAPLPIDKKNDKILPDGYYEREFEGPFLPNKKIPIPAYLIDEHVYSRCPTVIVSTADKIARLSYEPRASAIFGHVDKYNRYYGYFRENNDNNEYNKIMFPNDSSKPARKPEHNIDIGPLNAPDLIIQDELHLMNGPLGSLFGLYENVVEALIKERGGNPKYIASTATINNAENQVNLLFSKKFSQFPPHGLDISNNFFVRDDTENLWNEQYPGRIYMGIYAPGLGHFTHQVRFYSRLLKISNIYYKDLNKKNYWTVIGYYNAIRELGSAMALYKDDVLARIKHISNENNLRKLIPEEDSVELSSRIDSTRLPTLLDSLERDGNGEPPKYNAIFTTSMFGTGVDISHLSAMIMNAQPKTTGDYIQATGRIGRNYGGLVIDLLRSGRPRDLNHYEMFSSYHYRIYRDVEPISVSPFSEGCLLKGLGPSLVAFLRNAKNVDKEWIDTPENISAANSDKDLGKFIYLTEKRLKNMCLPKKRIKFILDEISNQINLWKNFEHENDLVYNEYRDFNGIPKYDVVLGDPAHDKYENVEAVYKNAPMSLREIEDTLGFWV